MSIEHHANGNGKSTVALVVQILSIVGAIAAPLILMYSKLNVMEVKLNEVETQFHARDQFDNVKLAQDQRMFTLLWEKTFTGSRYPTDAVFYPTIAKPNER